MSRLNQALYMKFPLEIGADGAVTSDRAAHVREQVEQVFLTNPGERLFRPDFGAGVMAMVFEPNNSALWAMTRDRLTASLADVLKGEVDPKTLTVEVNSNQEQLIIDISYTLAAIGVTEKQQIVLNR